MREALSYFSRNKTLKVFTIATNRKLPHFYKYKTLCYVVYTYFQKAVGFVDIFL
jgi:hypothetical protein